MAEKTALNSTERELKHLEGKHRELDKIIEHNESDSSPESWHILKNLKKKKLTLKDRIASLKSSLSRSGG
jgi:uncharacterized protein YdcH (DUF465 family)